LTSASSDPSPRWLNCYSPSKSKFCTVSPRTTTPIYSLPFRWISLLPISSSSLRCIPSSKAALVGFPLPSHLQTLCGSASTTLLVNYRLPALPMRNLWRDRIRNMAESIYLGYSDWEDVYIQIFTSNIRLILPFTFARSKFLFTIGIGPHFSSAHLHPEQGASSGND
jgi:hypothetical protein